MSAEAAASIRAPFASGNREELRALITGAGFRTVHIRIGSQMIAPSLPRGICAGVSVGHACGGCGCNPEEPIRAAILREVRALLQSYVDDDGMAVPIEAHVVVAEK